MHLFIQETIDKGGEILIVSGEGENGTITRFTGRRTVRAVKLALQRERRNGDRWARAKVFSHMDRGQKVYLAVDTCEYVS